MDIEKALQAAGVVIRVRHPRRFSKKRFVVQAIRDGKVIASGIADNKDDVENYRKAVGATALRKLGIAPEHKVETVAGLTPKFHHDCERCIFLGRITVEDGEYDLYYGGLDCNADIPTILARYGDEGHEYLSGMPTDMQHGSTINRVGRLLAMSHGLPLTLDEMEAYRLEHEGV